MVFEEKSDEKKSDKKKSIEEKVNETKAVIKEFYEFLKKS